MTLQEKVEKVLGLYPETRVSDLKLLARVWSEYYGMNYTIALVILAEANPSTISRAKRKIHEHEKAC